jgi:hypothetical protein
VRLLCLSYIDIRTEINPFAPAFSYNYLCTSTLLSAYIPIFFYIYLSEDLLLVASTTLLTQVDYQSLPSWLRGRFDGLLWPRHWVEVASLLRSRSQSFTNAIHSSARQSADSAAVIDDEGPLFSFDSKTRTELFHVESLVNKQTQDLLLFATFGLTCPLLGGLILSSIALRILRDQIIIGRYLSYSEQVQGQSPVREREEEKQKTLSPSVVLLSESLGHIGRAYHYRLWVIVWSSCLFFCFLCWDIAGDEVGFLRAVWVPLACFGYVTLVRLVIRWQRWQNQIRDTATATATGQLDQQSEAQALPSGIEFSSF